MTTEHTDDIGTMGELVCLSCARDVPAERDFCPHCGTPLNAYCTLDPWKKVFAEGQMYWRLTHGPMKLFVVISYFIILLVVPGLSWIWLARAEPAAVHFEWSISLLFGILYLGWVFLFTVRMIQNYLRHRHATPAGEEATQE